VDRYLQQNLLSRTLMPRQTAQVTPPAIMKMEEPVALARESVTMPRRHARLPKI